MAGLYSRASVCRRGAVEGGSTRLGESRLPSNNTLGVTLGFNYSVERPKAFDPITLDNCSDKMADDMLEVPETIQTAYMHSTHFRGPDASPLPRRDYRIHRVPSASDVGSIDTDIVPPSRTAKAQHRRPPIPDLRFEQSYLASISGAETWGKVAWITTRDQVRNY